MNCELREADAPEPLTPLPEVIEGNGDADWELWEAAMRGADLSRPVPADLAAA